MTTAPLYDVNGCHVGDLDLAGAEWRRAPDSEPDGKNVEVAFIKHADGVIYAAVRNAAEPDGLVQTFDPGEWIAFIGGLKDGSFIEPQAGSAPTTRLGESGSA